VKKIPGKPIVAVDIGGTKTIAAVLDTEYRTLARVRCLTCADEGPDCVIDTMVKAIHQAVKRCGLSLVDTGGVAIAAAAIIDLNRGLVTAAPNLPGWENIPLVDILAARLSARVVMLNDASAAAIGEHRLGAGRGMDNIIYITVSTGIGGGIVINGELYNGTDGCAAEIGHMIIDINGPLCKCGKRGCYEAMASGTAIGRMARERLAAGRSSVMLELADGRIDKVTAATVATAAARNDTLAEEVVRDAGFFLGIGLANLVNLINPQAIVVGGGVSKMGERILSPARKSMRQHAFKLPVSTVRVVRAGLGTDTGLIGAAIYAREVGRVTA
jgi:glucokinase